MATILGKIDKPFMIEQEISAGNNWNEADPPAGPTIDKTVITHAAGATGGKFDPYNNTWYPTDSNIVYVVQNIYISAGTQTTLDIYINDASGNKYKAIELGSSASFVDHPDYVLHPGYFLSVESTGASGAMKIAISFTPDKQLRNYHH